MTTAKRFRSIAVFGTGLIGASFALAVKKIWPSVFITGYDKNISSRKALARFGFDAVSDDLAVLCKSELLVLAMPVKANIDILKHLKPFVTPQTAICDMSSTKVEIMREAHHVFGKTVGSFVGLHPIAGKETSGFRNATATLFAGKPFAICIEKRFRTRPNVKQLIYLIEKISGNAFFISPEEHDRQFAKTSHVPQLVSTLLINFCEDGLTTAGSGLASSVRLARSSFEVWLDILETNRKNISLGLNAFGKSLIELANAIEQSDNLAVEAAFRRANKNYKKLFK
jgi:prephenate dehydrogenase